MHICSLSHLEARCLTHAAWVWRMSCIRTAWGMLHACRSSRQLRHMSPVRHMIERKRQESVKLTFQTWRAISTARKVEQQHTRRHALWSTLFVWRRQHSQAAIACQNRAIVHEKLQALERAWIRWFRICCNVSATRMNPAVKSSVV